MSGARRRGALAASLRARRREAALFKRLATLRTDVPLPEDLDDLRWRGAAPRRAARALCRELGDDELAPSALAAAEP